MRQLVETVLNTDPQAAVPAGACPECGGAVYAPGGCCIRCQRDELWNCGN